MGDNHTSESAVPTPYAMSLDDVLRALAEGQRGTHEAVNGLVQVVGNLTTAQNHPLPSRNFSGGPKVKDPRTYDGDRSDGKLDDHIRDVENWVAFWEARGHWTSEKEAVNQSANYLTGRMHRMFAQQGATLNTMPQYIAWLRRTFHDSNEQYHLRDEWQATVQGHRTVLEYASDLIYLAARIVPAKLEDEIKEHFRAGLSPRLQMAMAEHPEWDDLNLNEYIGRADRQDQIEEAKDRVRYQSGRHENSRGRAYAIEGAPRRGGRRPSSATRRPRKGSEEWQMWCKSGDACFECGNPGHIVRDCPQSSNRSPARSPSPYPQKGKMDRAPRNRSGPRPALSTRKPFRKNVSFQQGKDRA